MRTIHTLLIAITVHTRDLQAMIRLCFGAIFLLGLAGPGLAAAADPCDPTNPSFDSRDCADELSDRRDGLSSSTTYGSYDYDSSTKDTDGDGVVDAEDFCPTVESEEALGSAGEASLLHFYMGNNGITTIAQNIGVDLSKAVEGYDFSVLLKEDSDLGFVELNAGAEGAVDIWYRDASEDNFFSALREIVRRGYLVDVYVWSHGSSSGGDARFRDTVGWIWGSEIERELDPERIGCGGQFAPIRVVYSGACYNSEMNDSWVRVGARAAAGARYINFYPNQFGGFATSWAGGATFSSALDDADDASSRTLVQAYLQGLHLALLASSRAAAWYAGTS